MEGGDSGGISGQMRPRSGARETEEAHCPPHGKRPPEMESLQKENAGRTINELG